MPTVDPSASLTAYQSYTVARDAVAYDLGLLVVFALVMAAFVIGALTAGVLVTTGLRR